MDLVSVFHGRAVLVEESCSPNGIAASFLGTSVLVADMTNHTVKSFSLSGRFSGKFGHCWLGSVPWQLPYKIAADAKKRIYVVLEKEWTISPGRVKILDERGALLAQLPLQLRKPCGVTVDPEGRIIVLDLSLPRVLYVANWDGMINGTPLHAHLDNPVGLVAINEEVFICDATDRTIKVFSYDGVLKRTFLLEKEAPFAVRLNSTSRIVVGSHKPGEIRGGVNVFELDGRLIADQDFAMNQGTCLDIDCFGTDGVCISTSTGLIYVYEYSPTNLQVSSYYDSSYEPDTPPSSA